jgi:hypothetical protein
VDNTDGDDEFGPVTNLGFPRLDVASALSLTQARFAPISGPAEPAGDTGNYNSLAYDPQGILHFAWFDARDRMMKYATRSLAGNWSEIQIVDDSSLDVGQFVSLALDRNGKPSIAYFDGNQGDLKFATQHDGDWTSQTIDFKKSVGLYPSLAFDHQNHPLISYYRRTSGDLRLAKFDGTNWKIESVETGDDVGRSTSIAIDKNGRIGIAYENTTTGRLRFASLRTKDEDGNPIAEDWSIETADFTNGVAFISLKFDHTNRPNVSYYDASPANLKFAIRRQGKWSRNTIVSKGAVGLYTQLVVPREGGIVSIVFYNRTLNTLTLARGHLGEWKTTDLAAGGGRFATALLNPQGLDVTYVAFDTSDRRLLVSQISPETFPA